MMLFFDSLYHTACTNTVDTIWMKCDNKEDDAHWVEVINKAIETLARKPVFLTRPKIESAWHHESDRCSIIAMDALSSKVLFCCLVIVYVYRAITLLKIPFCWLIVR